MTRSDLCLDTEKVDSDVDVTKPGPPAFHHRCKEKFCQDHGVKWVATSEERTESEHRLKAILANLLLGVLALMGAGMVLSKRTH